MTTTAAFVESNQITCSWCTSEGKSISGIRTAMRYEEKKSTRGTKISWFSLFNITGPNTVEASFWVSYCMVANRRGSDLTGLTPPILVHEDLCSCSARHCRNLKQRLCKCREAEDAEAPTQTRQHLKSSQRDIIFLSEVFDFSAKWLVLWSALNTAPPFCHFQGLIKIRGDKCWRDLTCMDYHYEVRLWRFCCPPY